MTIVAGVLAVFALMFYDAATQPYVSPAVLANRVCRGHDGVRQIIGDTGDVVCGDGFARSLP